MIKEDIIAAQKVHYRDHQLASANQSELNFRTQLSSEYL
jgi:hypothetical protein